MDSGGLSADDDCDDDDVHGWSIDNRQLKCVNRFNTIVVSQVIIAVKAKYVKCKVMAMNVAIPSIKPIYNFVRV